MITADQLTYIFTFPFKDPQWKKKAFIGVLVGAMGFFIPVIPWILLAGYLGEILASAANGDEPALPEWDDIKRFFGTGVKIVGAVLASIFPGILLMLMGVLTMMGPVFLFMGSETANNRTFLLPLTFGLVGGAIVVLAIIYWLFVGLLLPVMLTTMLVDGEFKTLFDFRRWWPIFKGNLSGFILSYVLVMGVVMVVSYIAQLMWFTIVLICLMPILYAAVIYYVGLVGAVLFGQAYLIGERKQSVTFVPKIEGNGQDGDDNIETEKVAE